MPETKNALKRLIEIDKLLHNRYDGVTVGEMSEKFDVSRKTIENDLSSLVLDFEAKITKKKDGRTVKNKYENPHFSIFSPPLNEEEKNVLQSVFSMLSHFEDIPEKEWLESLKIQVDKKGFDKNNACIEFKDLESDEKIMRKLRDFYNHIVQKNVVKMKAVPYGKHDEKNIVFSPHFLKQYNERWYVFGWAGYDDISVYPLDRVREYTVITGEKYDNTFFDSKKYFNDIVGVTKKKNKAPQKIVLAVKKDYFPRLNNYRKIHKGQVEIYDYQNKLFPKEQFRFLSLHVIINEELKNRIWECRDNVFVLEPEELRNEFAQMIHEQNKIYCDMGR